MADAHLLSSVSCVVRCNHLLWGTAGQSSQRFFVMRVPTVVDECFSLGAGLSAMSFIVRYDCLLDGGEAGKLNALACASHPAAQA